MLTRILVPGRVAKAGSIHRHAVVYAGVRYLEALQRSGAVAMIVEPRPITSGEAQDLLAHTHGLLLIGGQDVDPHLYGEEPVPQVYGVRRQEDDFEAALVRAAIAMELPTLAVCRGAQLLNVACGGDLFQHISDDDGVLTHSTPFFPKPEPGSIGPVHPVMVDPGCRLAAALGTTVTMGSHNHHQAVRHIGGGLVVTARSADGVIEGFEHERGWVVGVQWHPEDTAADDVVQQRLFDAFVEQARVRAGAAA
ncbi:MAG TPA: gamma-glutamyl-gamma-aminobutyrate hydrolase family protein [Acidimicrobiales bacterium]